MVDFNSCHDCKFNSSFDCGFYNTLPGEARKRQEKDGLYVCPAWVKKEIEYVIDKDDK